MNNVKRGLRLLIQCKRIELNNFKQLGNNIKMNLNYKQIRLSIISNKNTKHSYKKNKIKSENNLY
jgi:hypothetical protein